MTSPLGVLRFSQTKAEKVPLNLIEVILAQGSTANKDKLSMFPRPRRTAILFWKTDGKHHAQ
jgi:hypothetical protein